MTEANSILDDYFSATFKPSAKIIQDNDVFFAKLRNIQEVYVLGHSLADVDRSYFDSVVKATNIDAVQWTIACREPTEMQNTHATVVTFGVPDRLIKTVLWNTL